MTDEQTKAVKALRDACEALADATEYLARRLFNASNTYSATLYANDLDKIDIVNEAIKEVERWIV